MKEIFLIILKFGEVVLDLDGGDAELSSEPVASRVSSVRS